MTIIGKIHNRIDEEWAQYEVMVLAKMKLQHPELRREAQQAFVAGAAQMYRIFIDQISHMTQQEQAQLIRDLGDDLRSFALAIGTK